MIMLGSAHEGDEFGRLNSSPQELDGQNTASIYMVVVDADAHYISCKQRCPSYS